MLSISDLLAGLTWNTRPALHASVSWLPAGPRECANRARDVSTTHTVASETLPGVMRGWQTGTEGGKKKRKNKSLTVLTAVSVQAAKV